ncbi:hypothetical protein BS50DRAFT_628022 [Corynespora cassiicola Philippines]|uniref:Peptidase A1 domain-containing protein n=1 Tax=Corynespora cassiicola Philippines TaxID=1448308 RepID=A0A2T2PB23_CORCC|nr:hypothetical protein BS50DRAFT_628022 [Corynespora cassiicola Philippines]
MVQNTFLALSLLATSALALKQAQTPMGADVVLPPLNLGDDLTYDDQTDDLNPTLPGLAPNGTRLSGPLSAPPSSASISENLIWASTLTKRPSTSIAISSIGVRKGGEVSAEALSAKIDLDSAYTSLPDFVYDIFAQSKDAVQPEELRGGDEVDCATVGLLPELTVNLEGGEEVTVKAEQYVKRTRVIEDEDEYEHCEALVRRAEEWEEEVTIGYPAMKGRRVVFDWAEGRVGFEV